MSTLIGSYANLVKVNTTYFSGIVWKRTDSYADSLAST